MDLKQRLHTTLSAHPGVHTNLDRKDLIAHAIQYKEAIASACGALATWNTPDSTGRSPKDTYIVRRAASEASIDWASPGCIPMAPDTFTMLWQDACRVLDGKDRLYVSDFAVGADPAYALTLRTVSPQALTTLFADNMFRPVPAGVERSLLGAEPFLLLTLPHDRIDPTRYADRLRKLPGGRTSDMAITLDVDHRLALVYGSAYCGTNKKLIFTIMNYLLPEYGILPLHCSANEGPNGDCALLLGLSGTGKTTLSADPNRALLGDDEHGWSDRGVANFEGGCYAKLINLRQDKEPEIYHATFHAADPLEHGTIIENCLMWPDGTFDVDDSRLTPNSRSSFPLRFLSNAKENPVSGHPTTVLFLTADTNGVLPPVARLSRDQAMLWFLMGYTSKLAGTETGVADPVSTFSRFFGAPFMPRNPDDYARLLGEKLERHGTQVYLVNTGWSGGPYGVGSRMDINLTRAIVDAALSGKLADVVYEEYPLFHFSIPTTCPGVPAEVLFPKGTWQDPTAYAARARKLAAEFAAHFDKAYTGKHIDPNVAAQCPGK